MPKAPLQQIVPVDINAVRRNAIVHDPSTIVKCGAFYYVFATGQGIASWRSPDLRQWERGPSVFPESDPSKRPAWWSNGAVVPAFDGVCWAPDVIKVGKRFLLYYSVSAWGKQTSAIGLVSSPTLDPTDKTYQWTDEGIVVQSRETDNWNAIDPSVGRDGSRGDLWLVVGSFWSGIKGVRLDAKTGKRPQTKAGAFSEPLAALAWNSTIEAACLFQRGKWWYLFVNWGWCCRGVNSSYEIRVGRSSKPTGPFRDREGRDLLKGGGSLFLAGDQNGGAFIGPGHAGIVSDGKNEYLSCHFYDGANGGRPTLGIVPLTWSGDGWPQQGYTAR